MRVFKLVLAIAVLVSFTASCGDNIPARVLAARLINTTPSQFVDNKATPPARKKVILFIHGIFGDTLGTWQHENGNTMFRSLRQRVAPADQYDFFAFGYPTEMIKPGSFSSTEAVRKLKVDLDNSEIFDRYDQVIIIAHSMGGLVALEMLTTYQNLATRVPLILTYSTPYEGAQVTNLARNLIQNPGLADMVPVDAENSFLKSLAQRWRVLKSQMQSPPRVACAYEKVAVPPLKEPIVPYSSAVALCDDAIAISADHLGIVKPDSDGHPIVDWTVSQIKAIRPPKPDLGTTTVSVTRIADFRKSVCLNSGRSYNLEITDEYTFSTSIDSYTLSANVEKPLHVRAFDLLQGGVELPSRQSCTPRVGKDDCKTSRYEWPKAAVVKDRKAKIKWVWTSDNPETIEGIETKARFPLTELNLHVYLPREAKITSQSYSPDAVSCAFTNAAPNELEGPCRPRSANEPVNDPVRVVINTSGLECKPSRRPRARQRR